jgi:hypothetical protein
MHKIRRPKIRLMLPESEPDVPPKPSPLDVEIARNKGTSVAVEATKESLQESKNDPTPSLSEMIEQKTRENGRLREELAHQQRKQGPNTYLLDKVTLAIEGLHEAVIEYHRFMNIIEEERGK